MEQFCCVKQNCEHLDMTVLLEAGVCLSLLLFFQCAADIDRNGVQRGLLRRLFCSLHNSGRPRWYPRRETLKVP